MLVQITEFKKEFVDLYLDAYMSLSKDFSTMDIGIVKKYFQDMLLNSSFYGFYFEQNGKAIGLILGYIMPGLIAPYYFLDDFLVMKNFQGKKYGTKMLNDLKERLKEKNIHSILLHTNAIIPAYSFYLNNGFEPYENSTIMAINF